MTKNTTTSYHARMRRALQHIEAHLEEDLPLDRLAAVACFSPHHFHRIFSGMVGESVKSHIRRLRLERAALRLLHGGAAVTDIALDAGYETPESFSRAFKAAFGVSPSGYRNEQRQRRIVPVDPFSLPAAETITGGMTMDVTIEQMPEKRVACARHVGPYAECGEAWGRLCAWAGPLGLLGPQSEFLGLSHDDPEVTPPEKLRYDACLVVDASVQMDGDIHAAEIGGGEYAKALHKGPYENLHKSYAYICGQWAPDSGREIAATHTIEKYLNDPNNTPPEELLTEIYVPLQA